MGYRKHRLLPVEILFLIIRLKRDVEDVVPYKVTKVQRVFCFFEVAKSTREICIKTTFVGGDVLDAPKKQTIICKQKTGDQWSPLLVFYNLFVIFYKVLYKW